jgi:ISXO2-like transposase domain
MVAPDACIWRTMAAPCRRRRPRRRFESQGGDVELRPQVKLVDLADNSAASIAAFVRANVKPGTTLLTDGHASYPGLSGYRHDPRVVGAMAGHVVLPWSHRAFSLLKRWALGT